MSYLVLARKYRPRNFTEMVGQDHVVRAMTNALTTQRLHHAYLFTGTRGVGKTSVARILAKSLNCRGSDGTGSITAAPCGVCQACVDIDLGRFVDYTELDAASNRGVDEVQALLEQAVYKPVLGRFKVFMIDEVHMLTNTAFNAMLKTLEEPPEYLKFVLATTDPQKVPVTVLSRCLQFNLRPMAPETIREHLERVLNTEQVLTDAQSLRLLARAARGSMRDALSLTDQAIAFGAGQLLETTVRQMLGSVDRSYVFRLIQALAESDGKTVVETSEVLRLNGLSAASTLEEMSSVLQRMAVMQSVPDAAAQGDETDLEAVEVARLAALMPADETQLLYSICLHGRSELGLAPDDYAALTMVLLRLLAFKPRMPGGAAIKKKALISPEFEPIQNASAAVLSVAKSQLVPTIAFEPLSHEFVLPEINLSLASSVGKASPATIKRVQPWENEPNIPLAVEFIDKEQSKRGASLASLPPGQQVPVRTMAHPPGLPMGLQLTGGPALASEKPNPSTMDALPVRLQADSRAEALASQAAAGVLVPSDEGEFWHLTVQQLIQGEAISALARELALQSQLVARDTDQWLLRVERESLNQSGTRERLASALVTAGHGVRLVVEIGRVTDSPARRNAAAAAERQLAVEKVIFDDPFVQSMMRDFGAKIVPGSIKPM